MLAEILLSMKTLAPVPITGEVTDLGSKLVWVVDQQGDMTLEQFLESLQKKRFHANQGEAPNLGFVHHPVYFAVAIDNRTDSNHFVLNIGYPPLDQVTLHVVSAQGISEPLTSGDHQPFSQRYRPYRTINFKVDTAPSETSLLVLRVKTASALQLPLKLHSEGHFGDAASSESLVLGLYYGLNLVMILYNAFLYLSLRMSGYLYYVTYLICHLLFQASLHGILIQFMIPNSPSLSDMLLWVWGSCGFFFAILFALHFHELEKRLPHLAMVAKVLMGLHVLLLLLNFVMPYHIVVRLGVLLTSVIDSMMMLVIGFTSLYHGYRPARFFVLGWGVLVLGNFIYGLKSFGILPTHFLVENSMLIGSSIEAILLSLALGDRVNSIQQERDDANRALIAGYSRLQIEIDRREELEKQKEALGREIRQATEQLIQADKMATMGQLVAGVAHDIANPTQLIINSKLEAMKTVDSIGQRLDALLEGNDPEVLAVKQSFNHELTVTRSSLHDIKTAVDRIEAIQSAIRNQTRLDTKPSLVQLRPLIDECLTILRSKLKPLRLHIECADELTFECRRSQLGQVITNLLSNAADALAEQGTTDSRARTTPQLIIRAGMEASVRGESLIYIEVEDDGPGIPADKAPHIFQAFYTTKAVGVGTGLGLSICKKITEAHGGRVMLHAARQLQGACFRIEIPAKAMKQAS